VLEARATGAIDAYGEPVIEGKRRPVRARAVEVDAKWLKAVVTWATSWQDDRGRYLLRENVIRGYAVPTEKNPCRPVASQDRFEALRAVTDRVPMELRWNGGRPHQRSYLSELLDIVNGTGRRISAVCQLRYDDLRLDQKPHGAIRWPAETDKQERETVVPIGPEVRSALDRVLGERPGLGAAYMFPAPGSRIARSRRTWLSGGSPRPKSLQSSRTLSGVAGMRSAVNGRPSGSICRTWMWLQLVGGRGPRPWCVATSRRMMRLCWPSCSVPVNSGKNRRNP